MERPVPAAAAETATDPNQPYSDEEATPEERAEMQKWDAWYACAGLSKTEAKRRYISTLIRTMHAYAAGTAEARALVEELEFVWEQVRGNSGSGAGSRNGSGRSGSGASGDLRDRRKEAMYDSSGLRVLRPMSDADEQDLEITDEEHYEDSRRRARAARAAAAAAARGASTGVDEDEDEDEEEFEDALEDSVYDSRQQEVEDDGQGGSGHPANSRTSRPAPHRWRRRVSRALVQMTAEVSAVRELVDSAMHAQSWGLGSTGSILGGSSSGAGGGRARPGILLRGFWLLWWLLKRVLVDAAVVALLIMVLRWRWRRKVESWWQQLGVLMGFVGDQFREQVREQVRELLRGVAAAGGGSSGSGTGLIRGEASGGRGRAES
jgi:hypothetical protein